MASCQRWRRNLKKSATRTSRSICRATGAAAPTRCWAKKIELNSVRGGGFFLEVTELVFQLHYAVAEALQNFSCLGGNGHAVLAMMARGGAAFDGISKFLAARAADAGTFS